MECEACQDRGWLIVQKSPRGVVDVERCDQCKKFDSDEAARVGAAKAFIEMAERRKKEPSAALNRTRNSTISDCILGIMESLNISQEQLDKILNEISNLYDSWVIDWIRENIAVSGPISEPQLEWR